LGSRFRDVASIRANPDICCQGFGVHSGFVRAGRLLEMLLLLQVRGGMTAPEVAAALEVSVRTVYRDVQALSGAGVPIYSEPGRAGGIRLLEGYDLTGLPSLDDEETRALLLAAVPSIARDLGVEPADEPARSLRDRLLFEPEAWWGPKDETPHLLAVARGVWDAREVRITYASASGPRRDEVVRPLGLVLKAGTWYLLARPRRGKTDRAYRLSRVREATVLDHRFERPADYDLKVAWEARKEAFEASIPTYYADVRVSPTGEPLLALLQEGTPALPLPDDVERDRHGWAKLRLRFERPESAARLLLQLGGEVEVDAPGELRDLMAAHTRAAARRYAGTQ
jgi:predicted DNA-binding transcriptional regulator YafY